MRAATPHRNMACVQQDVSPILAHGKEEAVTVCGPVSIPFVWIAGGESAFKVHLKCRLSSTFGSVNHPCDAHGARRLDVVGVPAVVVLAIREPSAADACAVARPRAGGSIDCGASVAMDGHVRLDGTPRRWERPRVTDHCPPMRSKLGSQQPAFTTCSTQGYTGPPLRSPVETCARLWCNIPLLVLRSGSLSPPPRARSPNPTAMTRRIQQKQAKQPPHVMMAICLRSDVFGACEAATERACCTAAGECCCPAWRVSPAPVILGAATCCPWCMGLWYWALLG